MAKIDYSKIFIKEACPTSIGGQAVMEGVMMQGPDRVALAMRLPSGELYLKTKLKKKQSRAAKIPFVRGIVSFANALVGGMGTLMESAEILETYAPEEYAEEEGKLEAWINKKFGEKAAWNFLITTALLFAIAISLVFFVILPTWVVNFLGRWVQSAIVLNLVEGIQVLEPERPDECCGFGGMFSIEETAVSTQMGIDKIERHMKTEPVS